ncbi:MAG: hypothetical protein JXQ93_02615 [Flavobacteriaceae bacterium]
MKKLLIYLLFLSAILEVQAQNESQKAKKYNLTDSIQTIELVRNFWSANRETSYLSGAPLISSIKDRRIPMREGESRGDYYLFEAFLNFSFPLFYGKKTHRQLYALEYTGNFRMTLDESKPLTPSSHHIGLSYYRILNKKIRQKKTNELHFTTLRVQLKHYSNGQAPGFFYVDPNDASNFRNSYLDGDFSTNYLNLWLTKGVYKNHGVLRQITFGYRHDIGTDESLFVFSKEQENSYGRHRFSFIYDYHFSSKTKNRTYEHHFRLQPEYIVGNLKNFRPNLKNDSKKYRFSVKGTYELAPQNFYAVGLFVSAYYGRDYINIRYDDIIYSLQFGITLDLNKFLL